MIFSLLTDLRNSLMAILPGFEVIRSYSQNVPRPAGEYVMMTTISMERLTTSSFIYNTKKFKTRTVIQLDIFSPNALDTAWLINHYYRSGLIDTIPFAGVIYVTNPRQMFLNDDERRMDERWVIELHIEREDDLTLPTESANTVIVSSFNEADTFTH